MTSATRLATLHIKPLLVRCMCPSVWEDMLHESTRHCIYANTEMAG